MALTPDELKGLLPFNKPTGTKRVVRLLGVDDNAAQLEDLRLKARLREKARREADPEAHRARSSAWYYANKEKAKAIWARWAEKNPERLRQIRKKATQKYMAKLTPEQMAERRIKEKQYREANRERIHANRRAREQAQREAKARERAARQEAEGTA